MKFIAVILATVLAASSSVSALPQNGSGLGSCSADAAKLVVGLGVDGEGERAQEVRAVPGGFKKDKVFGGQGSALAFGIVANFICDRLASDCKADGGVVSSCRAAQQKLVSSGAKGGKNLNAGQLAAAKAAADEFNKAIGIGGGAKLRARAGKLGSCDAGAARLVVGKGVDPEGERAQEIRAVPGGFKKDKVFGGQSSALAFGIVANFICDRLASDCKADAGVVSSCRNAQKEVAKFKGGKNLPADQVKALEGAAAAFNKAIGV
ncbi:hypothetical protein HDU97_009018 [Phlyctochytrium planicorne]|nr:hypothetical protein HDU97_009018 [Phlyctochytrium planicorne]